MADGSFKKNPRGFYGKLDRLPTHQQNQLRGWLCATNVKYPAIQDRLKREFGVSVSEAGIHRFWRRYILPALNLPQKRPAEYVIETHTMLRRGGAIVARSTTYQPLRNSGPLRRKDALALAKLLAN